MKNGKHGHASSDSLFKKSGEVVKMEQMLMLLIDLMEKLKKEKMKDIRFVVDQMISVKFLYINIQ